ncbi:interferon regulatory factor 3-like isoform X2 [Sinocyclocheilus grahami]|uniref:Interferon regulatory factor 3-like n=2 Tax=Sinocyclocheilus grahami TaxID=75366 RepID=A0A672RPF0_SINGR|nr:PREDICTED: interferon regulatory factor 3-like isoform X2 [Sinocyclocheilus grahami]
MAQPKPLFVPWLYEQIQSGSYPGVCWTNKEQRQFSIPWKHALRQDSNNVDVLIFKAWAQTSVAGDGRINGDPSVWKRNFRSALRAKGFKIIIDSKNDAANPHKVYQFPSEPHSAASGSEGSQETDFSPELYVEESDMFPTHPPQGLEQDFTGLNLQESPSRVHEVWNPDQLYLGFEEPVLYQETSPCPESQYTEIHYQIVNTHGQFSSAEGAIGGLGQIPPSEGATAAGHHPPAYQPEGEGVGHQGSIPVTKLETFFRIKVHYKGKIVKEELVENDAGFRLMYQGNMDESMGRADLPVVTLPTPEGILDQIQAKHTKEILNNLGGLEIRKFDGMVCGHRWGLSRIYWGLCKHENSPTPRELSKNTPEAIYNFRDYISGLMDFIQTSCESPSYALYFFLGEKWPDPKMRPWEKKLIMIEVILTSLEGLKMMAVVNGASSLRSVELQLSLEQMMELC